MRVVVDANVAIAAVATRGLCEAIMELCLEHHHVVLCDGILKEIDTKLKTRLKVPRSVRLEYLKLLRNQAHILKPVRVPKDACRDPKDLMILGLVSPGQIDAIVTGDKDLLVLKKYQGVAIMSPRTFWDYCKQED
jgi:putative PIN family toxin of toxin-antitoxin system